MLWSYRPLRTKHSKHLNYVCNVIAYAYYSMQLCSQCICIDQLRSLVMLSDIDCVMKLCLQCICIDQLWSVYFFNRFQRKEIYCLSNTKIDHSGFVVSFETSTILRPADTIHLQLHNLFDLKSIQLSKGTQTSYV